jgi:anthranilate phosphoribosyltransferase
MSHKNLTDLTKKVAAKTDLSVAEAAEAAELLVSAAVSDADKADFLEKFAAKGETFEEIAAFAQSYRARALNPEIDFGKVGGVVMDVCGTGADRLETFNVSTTVMFVLAAAGVPIAKHGNRSITSKSGSADVLEALGAKIDLPPDAVKRCVEEIGVGFMFAPSYHAAFRNVAAVRKQLAAKKVRTIFNILGPLVNPARVNAQLIGVFDASFTEKLARVLQKLGHFGAMVVHGRTEDGRGMDEISTVGPTRVSELVAGVVKTYELDPKIFNFATAGVRDFAGGDAEENAGITQMILSGAEVGPKRDLVLLNAAAAFVAGGKAESIEKGMELARNVIENGAAQKKLQEFVRLTQKLA